MTILERIATFQWKIMPHWQQEQVIAMKEQFDLTNRYPKYNKITLALFLASQFNPISRLFPGRPLGPYPGLWAAYHFCRKIDDIADGDQELPRRYIVFSDLQTDLKEAMRTGTYPDTDIGLLLRGTVRDMQKFHRVDIRGNISRFIDAMAYENQRRLERKISTRAELYTLYQSSFGVPQDIAFIGFGSKVRSQDVPELADLQGRIYAVRDLDHELSQGIIFIPKEAIPYDIAMEDLPTKYQEIPSITKWVKDELKEGQDIIERLNGIKLDKAGKKVVNFLTEGISRYLQKTSSS